MFGSDMNRTTTYAEHAGTKKAVEERDDADIWKTNGKPSWKADTQDRTIARAGGNGVCAIYVWQSLTGCLRGLGQAGSTRDAEHKVMQHSFTAFPMWPCVRWSYSGPTALFCVWLPLQRWAFVLPGIQRLTFGHP